MRQFIYKMLIVAVGIVLVYEFTIGKQIALFKDRADIIISKEGWRDGVDKLRVEIQKAVNIYQKGNLPKTEEIAKKLIDENPKMVFLYNLLGLALSGQNKIDEAIMCYEKGIQIDAKYSMIYY